MDSLYLLVPLSVALILATLGLFAWALHGGQYDDLAVEGERVLLDDTGDAAHSTAAAALDVDQACPEPRPEK